VGNRPAKKRRRIRHRRKSYAALNGKSMKTDSDALGAHVRDPFGCFLKRADSIDSANLSEGSASTFIRVE
jgi:hypothetical protein